MQEHGEEMSEACDLVVLEDDSGLCAAVEPVDGWFERGDPVEMQVERGAFSG